jgi:hypothetical protein
MFIKHSTTKRHETGIVAPVGLSALQNDVLYPSSAQRNRNISSISLLARSGDIMASAGSKAAKKVEAARARAKAAAQKGGLKYFDILTAWDSLIEFQGA